MPKCFALKASHAPWSENMVFSPAKGCSKLKLAFSACERRRSSSLGYRLRASRVIDARQAKAAKRKLVNRA
jgi:hypothetical protein